MRNFLRNRLIYDGAQSLSWVHWCDALSGRWIKVWAYAHIKCPVWKRFCHGVRKDTEASLRTRWVLAKHVRQSLSYGFLQKPKNCGRIWSFARYPLSTIGRRSWRGILFVCLSHFSSCFRKSSTVISCMNNERRGWLEDGEPLCLQNCSEFAVHNWNSSFRSWNRGVMPTDCATSKQKVCRSYGIDVYFGK